MDLIQTETLSQWLLKLHNPGHGLEYWHGYISSVICAPQTIMPSRWLPPVISFEETGERYEFQSEQDVQTKTGLVMTLYNELASDIPSERFKPYTGGSDEGYRYWAGGFILGINLWDKNEMKKRRDTLDELLMPVVFFRMTDEEITENLNDSEQEAIPDLFKKYKRVIRQSIPAICRLMRNLI